MSKELMFKDGAFFHDGLEVFPRMIGGPVGLEELDLEGFEAVVSNNGIMQVCTISTNPLASPNMVGFLNPEKNRYTRNGVVYEGMLVRPPEIFRGSTRHEIFQQYLRVLNDLYAVGKANGLVLGPVRIPGDMLGYAVSFGMFTKV